MKMMQWLRGGAPPRPWTPIDRFVFGVLVLAIIALALGYAYVEVNHMYLVPFP